MDYNHLISILDFLGIDEPLLSWLHSFVKNRIQWVNVDSSYFNYFTPFSDVSQGAILSPRLFALFVNLAAIILQHAIFLIFTEDIKVFFRIKFISECHLFQNDLQRLVICGEFLELTFIFPNAR